MRKAQLGSVSERLADDGTAKCPESLCPMSALPPSGRRVPPPLRALPLIHRSYGLMRPSPLALLSFGLSLVRGVFAGCDQPLLPAGCSRRYLCESFFWCLIPCHGGPTKCIYLFLPSCHRPPPEVEWVGFPLLTRKHDFLRTGFSRLQIFHNVQAPEFARLPDRSHRCAYSHRAAETFTSGQNVLRYLRTHRIY